MADRPEASRELKHVQSKLVGLPIWDPAVGVGSFLTIEFGGVRASSAGTPRGDFSLWIYGAQWAIQQNGIAVGDSTKDRDVMANAAERLSEQRVERFDVDPATLSLSLRLSEGLVLAAQPLGDPEMEEWLLYLDDGGVLTAGPGSNLSREDSSASVPLSADAYPERHREDGGESSR
jgi:hypothetical protein